MELRELRDFAKRMGGGTAVTVELGDERIEVEGLRAERTQDGETLVLVTGEEGGRRA